MLDGLKVLLAEDNPTNQMVAVQMLEALGASVTLAEDGVIALEHLGRDTFDVALVDVEMPRISGIEVISDVRKRPPPLCEMPMIALTAYVMQEHRDALAAAGVDGVIAKPILSIERFSAQILDFMRLRADPDRLAGDALNAGALDTLRVSLGRQALSMVLGTAAADLEAAATRLRRESRAGEIERLGATVHQLQGIASSIGADRLTLVLDGHISAGDMRNPQRHPDAVERLVSEIHRVKTALHREISD